MKQDDDYKEGRRSVITGLGLAAAGAGVAASMAAHAQRAGGFAPTRHDLDAWMDELPGGHRIFVDTASGSGGMDALRYATNIYNAQQSAYSGSDDDLAMIICFRHFSTPFGYSDEIWEKYSEQFAPLLQLPGPSGVEAPTANPVLNAAGGPGAVTISSLVARGTQFAICASATRFVSSQIANATGRSADEVFEELTASPIPNGRFVSAGVMALTRSQEYGYSMLYAG